MAIRTADGVRLRLPESWLEIDPRLPDLTTEVVRTLTEHGVTTHDESELARTVAPLAFELRRLSAHAEVLLVGLHTDFVDDGSGHVQVFTANVTVALSPPVGRGAGVRDEIQREALAGGVETGLHLLSGGPAFTTWGRVRFPRTGTEAFTRRFHIPVPGLDRVAVLAFSTPNVDFAAEFDRVFTTIADTFRFVG
ncbi:hypothetical protein AB0F15_39445 [Amycolatopsis sp. NPDC026612]|uniref:hypothetical protein n=1 Tax=Amycolatopsis sp. NPDC026612 TaxID=3155466 RepID=UPI00340F01E3